MDEYDYKILNILNDDGRVTIKQIHERLKNEIKGEEMGETSVYHKFYKLRDKNIIEDFSIVLDKDLPLFKEKFLLFIRISG